MVEDLEYNAIIEKLLEKTRAGRVPWEDYGGNEFRCDLSEDLPGGEKYTFEVSKSDDRYALTMRDSRYRAIFSVVAQEEIVYTDPAKEEIFDSLSELYELARRKGLHIPEKLANVVGLLDRI